jgi:hypothetical protein
LGPNFGWLDPDSVAAESAKITILFNILPTATFQKAIAPKMVYFRTYYQLTATVETGDTWEVLVAG